MSEWVDGVLCAYYGWRFEEGYLGRRQRKWSLRLGGRGRREGRGRDNRIRELKDVVRNAEAQEYPPPTPVVTIGRPGVGKSAMIKEVIDTDLGELTVTDEGRGTYSAMEIEARQIEHWYPKYEFEVRFKPSSQIRRELRQ